jgi:site-specific DNA-methyltransferase (adenine-specific)
MIQLLCGDCLELMPTLEADSVDAIITDLPYGTTACKWDMVIPFEPMWAQVRRILKPRGAFVTTASQPFTSLLIVSNLAWFKYEWIWEKTHPGDIFNAKHKPMRDHENIVVFSPGTTANGSDRNMVYNPQGLIYNPVVIRNSYRKDGEGAYKRKRPSHPEFIVSEYTGYPTTILDISKGPSPNHPTEKPVALLEYLIRTYTNEGDTVCDIAMGSGTTGVACVKTGRSFIGIERDADYFAISEARVADAQKQPRLMEV